MIYRFTLTYSGTETEVIQPRGWKDFQSEIKRDFKSHGAIYKFTSGVLKLGFADGRDIFENAFQTYGFDAVVTLTVNERGTEYDTWQLLFVGNAIMKNRELEADYFNVDFENSSFQTILTNRLKTKVRLDATEDLDGNAISPIITTYSNLWNGMRLREDYIAYYKTGASDTLFTTFTRSHGFSGSASAPNSWYNSLVVNFEGIITEEFKQSQVIVPALLNSDIASVSNYQQFVVANSGSLTIRATDIHYRWNGSVTTTQAADAPLVVYSRWKLRVEDSTGSLRSESVLSLESYDNGSGTVTSITFDTGETTLTLTETTVEVLEADLVYIYNEFQAQNSTGDALETITFNNNYSLYDDSQISLSNLKTSTTYFVDSHLIHDVFERIIYILTGRNYAFKSDFFGTPESGYDIDGCGGKVMITNGSKLRSLGNAVEISLSELIECVSSIYGTGWGFERSYDGGYDVRMELLEYFYRGDEIVDLGSPLSIKEKESYKETTFEPLVFNKVIIGYDTFTENEDYNGSLDDFLTKTEYSLPISSIDGNYEKKSKLIASGHLIQATFEQRINYNTSWKLDNKNFIVSMRRSIIDTFFPENDENFESVGGLDDSASTYNIRYAPVFMELNHALIINSALFGKSLSDTIQNTTVEINKVFNATFSSYEECLLGDSQRIQRSSIGNITIGNNYEGLRLFNPIEHELTVAMTNEQMDLIVDCMENSATDTAKNMGYVTYRNNDGEIKSGYLLNCVWNTVGKIAKINTLEKASNYGI
jgi:hypothetical protein